MAKADASVIADITAFLYWEARLLDEGKLREWLDLLDDGVRYYGPTRERLRENSATPKASPEGLAFDLFNDDKASLKMRVDRVLTGLAYSDLPTSITQHMISNVEVEMAESSDEYVVRSKFLVLQQRPGRHDGSESMFFGDRCDRLRRHGDGWRICSREIHIAHDVLPRAISILF